MKQVELDQYKHDAYKLQKVIKKNKIDKLPLLE